jgi:hypothetical protein
MPVSPRWSSNVALLSRLRSPYHGRESFGIRMPLASKGSPPVHGGSPFVCVADQSCQRQAQGNCSSPCVLRNGSNDRHGSTSKLEPRRSGIAVFAITACGSSDGCRSAAGLSPVVERSAWDPAGPAVVLHLNGTALRLQCEGSTRAGCSPPVLDVLAPRTAQRDRQAATLSSSLVRRGRGGSVSAPHLHTV